MTRSTALILLVATMVVAALIPRGVQGCPQFPPGQRCQVGRFLGPQWVWTGESITDITLKNDGQIDKWGPPSCCSICGLYTADDGSRPCIAFTLFLTSADNGNSTCTLKHTAMATGEKCPPNMTCISGKI